MEKRDAAPDYHHPTARSSTSSRSSPGADADGLLSHLSIITLLTCNLPAMRAPITPPTVFDMTSDSDGKRLLQKT